MNRNYTFQKEIVYQIYPKSFFDPSGSGIGKLKGITQKLDTLHDLGITMLWLCPIFDSPMVDQGYDIRDYKQIHPQFGTMADMDELIDEAKKRNIKIMLDLVLNHTSDQHPWFQKALNDPQSPYHAYYHFVSGTTPPNNLRSVFGNSCWEKVEGRDEYYFHSFSKEQPDLNWENPQVRQSLYEMIGFWKSKGIEAFRIDAINFIKKPQQWTDLEPDGPDGLAKCTRIVRNHPGLEKWLKELSDTCFKPDSIMTVAETAGLSYEKLKEYIGEDGFFSMVFDFKHADLDIRSGDEWFSKTNWKPKDFKEKLERSQLEIQKNGWAACFLENHDQPRATSKYLKEHQNDLTAQKMLAVLNMTLRGTPFIYQGQELGMINFKRDTIDDFDDVSSLDQYARSLEHNLSVQEALDVVNARSRDNARIPYPWDMSEYAGFSTKVPWLKINEQAKKNGICFQAQKDDPNSLRSFYKDLIRLRNKSIYQDALCTGTIEFLDTPDDVIGYRRIGQEHTLTVFCGFNKEPLTFPCSSSKKIFGNYQHTQLNDQTITLAPFEAVILTSNIKKKGKSDHESI